MTGVTGGKLDVGWEAESVREKRRAHAKHEGGATRQRGAQSAQRKAHSAKRTARSAHRRRKATHTHPLGRDAPALVVQVAADGGRVQPCWVGGGSAAASPVVCRVVMIFSTDCFLG